MLGLRHATDADHVVAVTTIMSRERRVWASAIIGAMWGLGHTITVLLVGGAIVLFRLVVPPRLGLGMELAVAVMLVALGVANLRGASRARPARHPARPVLVGVVHGLAGSAAAALLVLSTISGAAWGLFYLLLFGLGTVAGMMLLTTAMAWPIAFTAGRVARTGDWLARATGLGSVLLGAFVAYRVCVTHGLLSAAPHWTPQ